MAALFVQEGLRPKENAFHKTLSRIAIDATTIPREQIKRLKNMGFRTIGDYFSAPSRARQARIHQDTFCISMQSPEDTKHTVMVFATTCL